MSGTGLGRTGMWFRELACRVLGHVWRMRGENWAAFECARCRRRRLMLMDRDGKASWIITP